MNESSNEPRFDEHPESVTRQVAASDWSQAELEPLPEPPPPRERLFPRKVLIGWALFAVALYFGARIIGTVIKETVRESVKGAVQSGAARSSDRDIIYRTPNGKITISRKTPNGPITITTDQPKVPAPPTPDAAAAPKASAAAPAQNATPAPNAPKAKR